MSTTFQGFGFPDRSQDLAEIEPMACARNTAVNTANCADVSFNSDGAKEAVRASGAARACNQQFGIFATEVFRNTPPADRSHFYRPDANASAIHGFQSFLQTFV